MDFIAISEGIYADEQILGLSDPAIVRYIFLIAWSKHHHRDGVFTEKALFHCGGTSEEVTELINAGLVVDNQDGTWLIHNYGIWQWTSSEEGEAREQKRQAGVKSGEARRVQKESSPERMSFDSDAHFSEAYDLWPKGSGENRDYAARAYRENVKSLEDHENVMSGLRGFLKHRKTWSKEAKAKTGFFSNFLKEEKWLKYMGEAEEAIRSTTLLTPAPESETERHEREMIEMELGKGR